MPSSSILPATVPADLADGLPEGLLLAPGEGLTRCSRDWSGDHYGRPLPVARPRTVDAVSVLRCHCFGVIGRFGGSIGAEHGIGRVKQAAFLDRIDAVSRGLARRLKDALDPTVIMSEGRLLSTRLPVRAGDQ